MECYMSSYINKLSGTLDGLSSSVVTSDGSRSASLAVNVSEFEYITIDGQRWGGMATDGAVCDHLENAIGKHVTVYYTEKKVGSLTKRLMVGIEVDNGGIESISTGVLEPSYKGIRLIWSSYTFVAFLFWTFIGGFISVAVAHFSNSNFFGFLLYFGVSALIIFGSIKLFKSRMGHVKEAVAFARKHCRVL